MPPINPSNLIATAWVQILLDSVEARAQSQQLKTQVVADLQEMEEETGALKLLNEMGDSATAVQSALSKFLIPISIVTSLASVLNLFKQTGDSAEDAKAKADNLFRTMDRRLDDIEGRSLSMIRLFEIGDASDELIDDLLAIDRKFEDLGTSIAEVNSEAEKIRLGKLFSELREAEIGAAREADAVRDRLAREAARKRQRRDSEERAKNRRAEAEDRALRIREIEDEVSAEADLIRKRIANEGKVKRARLQALDEIEAREAEIGRGFGSGESVAVAQLVELLKQIQLDLPKNVG